MEERHKAVMDATEPLGVSHIVVRPKWWVLRHKNVEQVVYDVPL